MFESGNNSGYPFAESAGRQIGYFDPNQNYSAYDWIIADSENGRCYAAGKNDTFMLPAARNYGYSAVEYVRSGEEWVVKSK